MVGAEFIIAVDSREQEPWGFSVPVVRKKLDAGDYSVVGLEAHVAVERKSVQDFLGTVIRGRDRFRQELLRLQGYELACVVVEGNFRDLLDGRYVGGAHPHAVVGSALSIIVDYGIPVYFCSDRQASCRFVEELLTRFHRRFAECPLEIKTPQSSGAE